MRLALAVAAALLLTACRGPRTSREEGVPGALVMCPAARRAEAESLAAKLEGYDARVYVTEIARAKSSVAVYGIGEHPERIDAAKSLASAVDGAELLTFLRRGNGGNAIVVWLAPR